MEKLILASASPRRFDLLKTMGLHFDVIAADVDENIKAQSPEEMVAGLSHKKAAHVNLETGGKNIIIGADTVVVLEGQILQKPINRDEAFSMLSNLSNKVHKVYTGVSIIYEETIRSFVEVTEVKMGELSPELINAYLDTGEYVDKAGAYGIQGLGALLVSGVNGDYYNVVGLPIYRLCKELRDMLGPKAREFGLLV